MIKKIIYLLCLLRNKFIDRDDFAWKRYHKNYSNQIIDNEKVSTLKLSNDFKLTDKIEFLCEPPLSVNAELLYKVIYDLNPKTIHEVGCGGGDHMFNIKKILPSVDITGSDLLPKQLDYLDDRSPELKGLTIVNDITKEMAIPSELIYTQAVIMHIQKANRHLDALRNLFKSSIKYVILMENWSRHDFYSDIKNLSLGDKFSWDDLYIYGVDSGKQIIMVLSKEPISDKKLNYIELKSNKEMLKYLD